MNPPQPIDEADNEVIKMMDDLGYELSSHPWSDGLSHIESEEFRQKKIEHFVDGQDGGDIPQSISWGLARGIKAHTTQAVTAAYNRGYNTGWQKSNRRNDDSRLPKVANQLRQILKSIENDQAITNELSKLEKAE